MHNFGDDIPAGKSTAEPREDVPLRPYDIRPSQGVPSFAAVLGRFADRFLEQAEVQTGKLIDLRMDLGEGPAARRSRGEYAIELLSLAVLRTEYGPCAAATSPDIVERLSTLWRIRQTEPSRKAEADKERARVFLTLLKSCDQADNDNNRDDHRLIDWLVATGEFVQEALRLRQWVAHRDCLCARRDFERAIAGLAAWFEREAGVCLGRFTPGVRAFRAQVMAANEAREDLFLITRSERLYHLNMLGAEVMNRGFRAGFEARSRKVVLVPGCMRARNELACQARRDGLDVTCARCQEECAVAKLDRLGHDQGFRVFIVPHASSFTAWLDYWSNDATSALVAAACPLHLVPGAYEMRALGLQAQCVLLDYSGCRRHWDANGTPTTLDRNSLLRLVGKRGEGGQSSGS